MVQLKNITEISFDTNSKGRKLINIILSNHLNNKVQIKKNIYNRILNKKSTLNTLDIYNLKLDNFYISLNFNSKVYILKELLIQKRDINLDVDYQSFNIFAFKLEGDNKIEWKAIPELGNIFDNITLNDGINSIAAITYSNEYNINYYVNYNETTESISNIELSKMFHILSNEMVVPLVNKLLNDHSISIVFYPLIKPMPTLRINTKLSNGKTQLFMFNNFTSIDIPEYDESVFDNILEKGIAASFRPLRITDTSGERLSLEITCDNNHVNKDYYSILYDDASNDFDISFNVYNFYFINNYSRPYINTLYGNKIQERNQIVINNKTNNTIINDGTVITPNIIRETIYQNRGIYADGTLLSITSLDYVNTNELIIKGTGKPSLRAASNKDFNFSNATITEENPQGEITYTFNSSEFSTITLDLLENYILRQDQLPSKPKAIITDICGNDNSIKFKQMRGTFDIIETFQLFGGPFIRVEINPASDGTISSDTSIRAAYANSSVTPDQQYIIDNSANIMIYDIDCDLSGNWEVDTRDVKNYIYGGGFYQDPPGTNIPNIVQLFSLNSNNGTIPTSDNSNIINRFTDVDAQYFNLIQVYSIDTYDENDIPDSTNTNAYTHFLYGHADTTTKTTMKMYYDRNYLSPYSIGFNEIFRIGEGGINNHLKLKMDGINKSIFEKFNLENKQFDLTIKNDFINIDIFIRNYHDGIKNKFLNNSIIDDSEKKIILTTKLFENNDNIDSGVLDLYIRIKDINENLIYNGSNGLINFKVISDDIFFNAIIIDSIFTKIAGIQNNLQNNKLLVNINDIANNNVQLSNNIVFNVTNDDFFNEILFRKIPDINVNRDISTNLYYTVKTNTGESAKNSFIFTRQNFFDNSIQDGNSVYETKIIRNFPELYDKNRQVIRSSITIKGYPTTTKDTISNSDISFNVTEKNTYYFDMSDPSNKGSRLRFFTDVSCNNELFHYENKDDTFFNDYTTVAEYSENIDPGYPGAYVKIKIPEFDTYQTIFNAVNNIIYYTNKFKFNVDIKDTNSERVGEFHIQQIKDLNTRRVIIDDLTSNDARLIYNPDNYRIFDTGYYVNDPADPSDPADLNNNNILDIAAGNNYWKSGLMGVTTFDYNSNKISIENTGQWYDRQIFIKANKTFNVENGINKFTFKHELENAILNIHFVNKGISINNSNNYYGKISNGTESYNTVYFKKYDTDYDGNIYLLIAKKTDDNIYYGCQVKLKNQHNPDERLDFRFMYTIQFENIANTGKKIISDDFSNNEVNLYQNAQINAEITNDITCTEIIVNKNISHTSDNPNYTFNDLNTETTLNLVFTDEKILYSIGKDDEELYENILIDKPYDGNFSNDKIEYKLLSKDWTNKLFIIIDQYGQIFFGDDEDNYIYLTKLDDKYKINYTSDNKIEFGMVFSLQDISGNYDISKNEYDILLNETTPIDISNIYILNKGGLKGSPLANAPPNVGLTNPETTFDMSAVPVLLTDDGIFSSYDTSGNIKGCFDEVTGNYIGLDANDPSYNEINNSNNYWQLKGITFDSRTNNYDADDKNLSKIAGGKNGFWFVVDLSNSEYVDQIVITGVSGEDINSNIKSFYVYGSNCLDDDDDDTTSANKILDPSNNESVSYASAKKTIVTGDIYRVNDKGNYTNFQFYKIGIKENTIILNIDDGVGRGIEIDEDDNTKVRIYYTDDIDISNNYNKNIHIKDSSGNLLNDETSNDWKSYIIQDISNNTNNKFITILKPDTWPNDTLYNYRNTDQIKILLFSNNYSVVAKNDETGVNGTEFIATSDINDGVDGDPEFEKKNNQFWSLLNRFDIVNKVYDYQISIDEYNKNNFKVTRDLYIDHGDEESKEGKIHNITENTTQYKISYNSKKQYRFYRIVVVSNHGSNQIKIKKIEFLKKNVVLKNEGRANINYSNKNLNTTNKRDSINIESAFSYIKLGVDSHFISDHTLQIDTNNISNIRPFGLFDSYGTYKGLFGYKIIENVLQPYDPLSTNIMGIQSANNNYYKDIESNDDFINKSIHFTHYEKYIKNDGDINYRGNKENYHVAGLTISFSVKDNEDLLQKFVIDGLKTSVIDNNIIINDVKANIAKCVILGKYSADNDATTQSATGATNDDDNDDSDKYVDYGWHYIDELEFEESDYTNSHNGIVEKWIKTEYQKKDLATSGNANLVNLNFEVYRIVITENFGAPYIYLDHIKLEKSQNIIDKRTRKLIINDINHAKIKMGDNLSIEGFINIQPYVREIVKNNNNELIISNNSYDDISLNKIITHICDIGWKSNEEKYITLHIYNSSHIAINWDHFRCDNIHVNLQFNVYRLQYSTDAETTGKLILLTTTSDRYYFDTNAIPFLNARYFIEPIIEWEGETIKIESKSDIIFICEQNRFQYGRYNVRYDNPKLFSFINGPTANNSYLNRNIKTGTNCNQNNMTRNPKTKILFKNTNVMSKKQIFSMLSNGKRRPFR